MSRWAKAIAGTSRTRLRIGSIAAIGAIAVIDRAVMVNLGLGFLYVIPIVVCAFALSRLEIVLMAIGCSLLREAYAPFAWQAGWPFRLEATGFALMVTGLLVSEIERGWTAAEQYARTLARESQLRRGAEAQTRTVLETSPLAILAVEDSQRILLANEGARLLFGSETPLAGKDLREYLPNVQALFDPSAWDGRRTMVETRGLRPEGEAFVAQVWCSAVKDVAVPQFTLVVWDATDSLRDREEAGLANFLTTSRIVVGAVSHEIRNMSAAASVALSNLGKDHPALAGQRDYQALGSLIGALEEMARLGLRTPGRKVSSVCDLSGILQELRIVIEPMAGEAAVTLEWAVETDLPKVRGDHVGLLQVFLNLSKNSIEAMTGQSGPRKLRISAGPETGCVTVDLRDSGPGIGDPDALFRPFQDGASHTGLGLYVSRAIMRAFAGELLCRPAPAGAWFQVKLAVEERRAAIG